MSREDNQRLIQRWIAAYNAFDLDAVNALYADDCIYIVRSYGLELRGRVAQRNLMESIRQRFPDRQMHASRLIIEDDVIAVEAAIIATSPGGQGLPPPGDIYRSECCFVLTIANGQIVHEHDYIDRVSAPS